MMTPLHRALKNKAYEDSVACYVREFSGTQAIPEPCQNMSCKHQTNNFTLFFLPLKITAPGMLLQHS
jgi:hypothetical protein